MAISKNVTFPNGVVGNHHVIDRISFVKTPGGYICNAQIASWISYTDYVEGKPPIHRHPVSGLPLSAPADLFLDIDRAMKNWSGGPLHGGNFVSEVIAGGIDQARANKWREILIKRDSLEFGTFEYQGLAFDCDAISQARIMGSAQIAILAISKGAPEEYSDEWTLADNTKIPVSAAEMVAIGLAMGSHIRSVHAIARNLREQIYAAETEEAVEAINWPMPQNEEPQTPADQPASGV